MKRLLVPAALAGIVAAACSAQNRYARVVKIGDTEASLKISATADIAPVVSATVSPPAVPVVAQAFAEFMGATVAYTPETPTLTVTATPGPRWHTAGKGDTLASLARRYYGNASEAWRIAGANGIGKKKPFRPGMRLRIPYVWEGLPSPTVTPTTTQTATTSATATSLFVAFEGRTNSAFGPGEKLKFAVQYMGITGGFATMEISEIAILGGERTFHIHTTAISTPLFSKFFRVEDSADSYLDVKYLFSRRFEKRIHEGSFRPKPQRWDFDHAAQTALDHDGKSSPIVRGEQDILSAFYFFRTIPLPEKEAVSIPVYADGKTYDLLIHVTGRETITVPAGTFRTIVVEPQLKFAGLFQQKGKVTIWVTDDARRVPVQVKSKIVIGSIDIVLVDAEVLEPIP